MAYGLIEAGSNLDLDLISKYYILWVKTNPFDIGTTTL
jgi:hypothetical protein